MSCLLPYISSVLDLTSMDFCKALSWLGLLIGKDNEPSSLNYSTQGTMEDPAKYRRSKILLNKDHHIAIAKR